MYTSSYIPQYASTIAAVAPTSQYISAPVGNSAVLPATLTAARAIMAPALSQTVVLPPAPAYSSLYSAGTPAVTVRNVIAIPQQDPHVVLCNPNPPTQTRAIMTRDSKAIRRREKRLARYTTPVPTNTTLPFTVAYPVTKKNTDRFPGSYNNQNYHAGPFGPYIHGILF
jgi:hypothetical protein